MRAIDESRSSSTPYMHLLLLLSSLELALSNAIPTTNTSPLPSTQDTYPSLEKRNVTSWAPFLNPRNTHLSWSDSTGQYTIDLNLNPLCHNQLTASTLIGPYITTLGTLLPTATLSEITSDIWTLWDTAEDLGDPTLVSRKSLSLTKQNVDLAITAIQTALKTSLCDAADGMALARYTDELKRRKLLQWPSLSVTLTTLTGILSNSAHHFFAGAAITAVVDSAYNGNVSSENVVRGGSLLAAGALMMSFRVYLDIYAGGWSGMLAVTANAFAAWCRRAVGVPQPGLPQGQQQVVQVNAVGNLVNGHGNPKRDGDGEGEGGGVGGSCVLESVARESTRWISQFRYEEMGVIALEDYHDQC